MSVVREEIKPRGIYGSSYGTHGRTAPLRGVSGTALPGLPAVGGARRKVEIFKSFTSEAHVTRNPVFQRFSLVLLTGESRLPGPGAALSLCRWAGAGQAKAGEAGRRRHSRHSRHSRRALAPVVPSLPPEDGVFPGLHNNGRPPAPLLPRRAPTPRSAPSPRVPP